MVQLHVWGIKDEVSVISPQCVAISWIVNDVYESNGVPFEIVPSNNTNVSKLNQLPTLIINESEQYNGYIDILNYVTDKYTPNSNAEQLKNNSLISFILNKLEILNQYNLFINNENYEKYTRKLITRFYPFPMMYNKSLKLYNNAEQLVKLSDLGHKSSRVGFLNFGTNEMDDSIAQTETFNDEMSDDEDTKAISSLHEKQLLKKQHTKKVLRESKNSLRCLNLLNGYLDEINNLKSEMGSLFQSVEISSSEILLAAYLNCLTYDKLPDRFLFNFMNLKRKEWLDLSQNISSKFKISKSKFRDPIREEEPNLSNEIRYWYNYYAT